MIGELLSKFTTTKVINHIEKDFKKYAYKKYKQKDFILIEIFINPEITTLEIEQNLKVAGIQWADTQRVRVLSNRLNESGLIDSEKKEGQYKQYISTELGKAYISKIVNDYLDNNRYVLENREEERKKKVDSKQQIDKWKIIAYTCEDMRLKPNFENKIIVDLKKLSEFNFEATDLIYEDILDGISAIQSHYRDDVEDLQFEDVIFKNPHKSTFKKISHIDRKSKHLINTKGLITSKKEDVIVIETAYDYLCINPSCVYSEEKIKSHNLLKVCPKCKSGVGNPEYIYEENHYISKLSDVESGLSIDLIFKNNKIKDFSLVELGDEIEVIGHLENVTCKKNENGRIEKKVGLVVNNFNKTDFVESLKKEEIKKAKKFLEKFKTHQELRDYLLKPFGAYIEKDFIKELTIKQQLSKLNREVGEVPFHLAIMGEAGVGKNELLRICEKYFSLFEVVDGADVTDAGFKGTVNRDTGIKDMGLAKKCQNGTVVFNEFDKFVKMNNNGKKAGSQIMNGTCTEQRVKITKAGIKIVHEDLNLRHMIIFNPLEDKIAQTGKPAHHFMGEIVDKSLLSRMIPIYIPKDKDRSKLVFDLKIEKNFKNFEVDEDEYKLLIKYLRNVEVSFTSEAKKNLKEFYNTLVEKDEEGLISPERIGELLIQISLSNAKFKNKSKCGVEEVKEAIEIYLSSLKSIGIDLDNLQDLVLENTIEEIKTIQEFKKTILSLVKDNLFKIEDLEKLGSKEMIDKAIDKLKSEGLIYEPKKGYILESKNM